MMNINILQQVFLRQPVSIGTSEDAPIEGLLCFFAGLRPLNFYKLQPFIGYRPGAGVKSRGILRNGETVLMMSEASRTQGLTTTDTCIGLPARS